MGDGIATALRVLNKRPVRVSRLATRHASVIQRPARRRRMQKQHRRVCSVPSGCCVPSLPLYYVEDRFLAALEVVKRNGPFFQIALVVERDVANYPVVIG